MESKTFLKLKRNEEAFDCDQINLLPTITLPLTEKNYKAWT